MSIRIYAEGFVVGFAIAAPIGPVSLLFIRRTMVDGRVAGLLSALGAALADAVAGGVAAFGLTYASELLSKHDYWLRFGGGLALVLAGGHMLARRAATAVRLPTTSGHLAAFTTTFALTVANPITFLAFGAAIASFGFVAGGDPINAMWMTAGVFSGSFTWWILLCTGVDAAGARLSERVLARVDRATGVAIAALGVLCVFSLGSFSP